MIPRAVGACLSLVLLSGTAGAAVWIVDDGGGPGVHFTEVQAAVNAAADGDTILIRPGSYSAVSVQGKSLTLVRDGAGDVKLAGLSVRTLSAAQSVRLRGLRSQGVKDAGVIIETNQGPVLIEDCSFVGSTGDNYYQSPTYHWGWPGASVADCASVTFVRCTLKGGHGPDVISEFPVQVQPLSGGPGLFSQGAQVALYECTAAGAKGGDDWEDHLKGGDGGDGATIVSGFLFASGSTFNGGFGGFGGYEVFSGCGSGGSGGDGLQVMTGAESAHLDCTFHRGDGGASGGYPCSNGATGMTVDPASVAMHGRARSLTIESPVRETPANLSVVGLPGDTVLLLASLQHGFAWHPHLKGVLTPLAAPPLGVSAVDLGIVLGPAGMASLTVPTAVLPPSVPAIQVTVQAAMLGADGVTLSSPSHLTVVDSSL